MTSVATLEFLAYLSSLDIKLSVSENRLRYNAPEGVLTPVLRAELADRKSEIIAFLRQTQGVAHTGPSSIQPVSREGDLPLSFAQQRLWFFDQLEPNNSTYNEPLIFRLSGSLRPAVLERSLQEIIQRHEALRTVFVTVDGQPKQVIRPASAFSLPIVDFSAAPAAEADAQSFIRQELQRPFDLAEGPLLRTVLLRLQPDNHLFLIVMHHIITDGWSMGLLTQELGLLYDYFAQDAQAPYPLPQLPIQYADFAHWQRQWLTGSVLENQAAYWEQQLKGSLPMLSLPTDRPRPAMQTFHGATYSARLGRSLTESLQQVSQQRGVTLFMTLLAAFKLLLYRYTGQADLLVGAPIANRNRSEIEKLIGFFVNTLVLRSYLGGNPTFGELLGRVREVALGAYAHQDLPFEKLIEKLQPERSLSHQPLFQVMFVFENAPMPPLQFSGLSVAPLKIETGIARFDLTLFIEEDQEGLTHTWEYNTDLFESATIARMAAHFQTLLENLVASGFEQRLSDVPLLTAAERNQILFAWNQTQADFPAQTCFHHLFELQVEQTPEAIAVAFNEDYLTYQSLNSRANQLAHYLRRLGLKPDTLVGLCLERSPEMIIALLGVLKAGGAYVPLDPTYPPGRLAFMIEDSEASILLTQRHLADRLGLQDFGDSAGLKPRLLCLDAGWAGIAQESQENPAPAATPDHLAYVIYTSGSTGRPKGVMIPHRGLVNYLSWAKSAYRVAEGQGAPVHSSLSFDLTVTGLLLPLLVGGAVTLLPEDQTGETLSDALRSRKNFSLVKITPAHLQLLSHQLPPDEAAQATHSLIIGGEALFGQDLLFWQRHAPQTRLINEYGPTETVVGCCVYELSSGGITSETVPIGRPIANTQLYLLDQYLQPAPVGVPAELYIGGAGVARGYLKRPELTAERFIPDPFSLRPGSRLYKTGDLARYRADGVLEFLGRLDHQVKIRGFRIELGEIEAALSQHPAVKEAVVLAWETTPGAGSKHLVAYLVPARDKPTSSPGLIRELRQFLQTRLPDYMVPAVFILLESLPLTPNGKLDHRALPDPAAAKSETAETFVASRTHAEASLARIWAELLGLKQVGIYDNFFELGGDSILGIQVIARANQAGLRLTPRQLFQYQTIAELAIVADTTLAVRAEQNLVTGPVPLIPIQHWFFEKKLPEPHHWNMAMLLEVQQTLEPVLLEQVIEQLLNHHDALRLRFSQVEEGWQQTNAGLEDYLTPFVRFDLSALSAAEQTTAIETQAAKLQASLNLAYGPLIRVALFDLGSLQPNRLLIVIHHLVVDGVSWRILLEDLQTAYEQLNQGKPIRLPAKTTAFQQWANLLNEIAAQYSHRPETGYWLAESRRRAPRLPLDYPENEAANTEASAGVVLVRLEAIETRILLQEVPAVYHTQINDLLLTALVQAFKPWTGAPALLVDLEGHGREEIIEGVDLSRTVGWFTTIFPVYLSLAGAAQPGEAIKSIKEQLRQIPNRGIDYGLLRYPGEVAIRRQLQEMPQAEISFNYLGQFDQTLAGAAWFKPAREASGPVFGPQGRRGHLIEISGSIIEGRLELEWAYSQKLHHRTTVEALAHRFIEALRFLIVHCQSTEAGGYTPSDFPEAGLTQAELDSLLAELNE